MYIENTNIGDMIRELRKARELSRKELSEMIGISMSHLEKIESGARRPGMDTYQRLLRALKAEVIMHDGIETVQEKCAVKAKAVFLKCTEKQALYLVRLLELQAQSIMDAGWN